MKEIDNKFSNGDVYSLIDEQLRQILTIAGAKAGTFTSTDFIKAVENTRSLAGYRSYRNKGSDHLTPLIHHFNLTNTYAHASTLEEATEILGRWVGPDTPHVIFLALPDFMVTYKGETTGMLAYSGELANRFTGGETVKFCYLDAILRNLISYKIAAMINDAVVISHPLEITETIHDSLVGGILDESRVHFVNGTIPAKSLETHYQLVYRPDNGLGPSASAAGRNTVVRVDLTSVPGSSNKKPTSFYGKFNELYPMFGDLKYSSSVLMREAHQLVHYGANLISAHSLFLLLDGKIQRSEFDFLNPLTDPNVKKCFIAGSLLDFKNLKKFFANPHVLPQAILHIPIELLANFITSANSTSFRKGLLLSNPAHNDFRWHSAGTIHGGKPFDNYTKEQLFQSLLKDMPTGICLFHGKGSSTDNTSSTGTVDIEITVTDLEDSNTVYSVSNLCYEKSPNTNVFLATLHDSLLGMRTFLRDFYKHGTRKPISSEPYFNFTVDHDAQDRLNGLAMIVSFIATTNQIHTNFNKNLGGVLNDETILATKFGEGYKLLGDTQKLKLREYINKGTVNVDVLNNSPVTIYLLLKGGYTLNRIKEKKNEIFDDIGNLKDLPKWILNRLTAVPARLTGKEYEARYTVFSILRSLYGKGNLLDLISWEPKIFSSMTDSEMEQMFIVTASLEKASDDFDGIINALRTHPLKSKMMSERISKMQKWYNALDSTNRTSYAAPYRRLTSLSEDAYLIYGFPPSRYDFGSLFESGSGYVYEHSILERLHLKTMINATAGNSYYRASKGFLRWGMPSPRLQNVQGYLKPAWYSLSKAWLDEKVAATGSLSPADNIKWKDFCKNLIFYFGTMFNNIKSSYHRAGFENSPQDAKFLSQESVITSQNDLMYSSTALYTYLSGSSPVDSFEALSGYLNQMSRWLAEGTKYLAEVEKLDVTKHTNAYILETYIRRRVQSAGFTKLSVDHEQLSPDLDAIAEKLSHAQGKMFFSSKILDSKSESATVQVAYPVIPYLTYGQGDYSMVQITNRFDLIKEGRTMHHCAADYNSICLSGESVVCHLDHVDGRSSTIEFKRNADNTFYVRQHRTLFDAEADTDLQDFVNNYLKVLNRWVGPQGQIFRGFMELVGLPVGTPISI